MTRIVAGSVTLLRNNAGLLPLAPQTGKKVLVAGLPQVTVIGQAIAARGLTPQVLDTGINPTQSMIHSAVAAASNNDLVLVTTFNAMGRAESTRPCPSIDRDRKADDRCRDRHSLRHRLPAGDGHTAAAVDKRAVSVRLRARLPIPTPGDDRGHR